MEADGQCPRRRASQEGPSSGLWSGRAREEKENDEVYVPYRELE